MHDVALYGHLTLDRIFNGFKTDQSVGSIGNVWKHLKTVSPKLNIHLGPTDIGEALILIDEHSRERSSIANLSIKTKDPTLKKSKWSHVLYINELSNIDYIKDIKDGIVSADVCRGKKIKDLQILQQVDYLFLSDEDLDCNPKDLLNYLRKGMILHSPSGSVFYNKQGIEHKNKVDTIGNVNVLGCGDMLAAGFIAFSLEGLAVPDALKKAHEEVTKVLKQQGVD
jgi:sugar/nucleoside kinase (ribokinase family)